MELNYDKRYIAGVEGESKSADGSTYTCFKLFVESNTLKEIKQLAIEAADKAGRIAKVWDNKKHMQPCVFEYDPVLGTETSESK